ncbi:MAG: chemotaxis protein CheA, partial [bacterium]
ESTSEASADMDDAEQRSTGEDDTEKSHDEEAKDSDQEYSEGPGDDNYTAPLDVVPAIVDDFIAEANKHLDMCGELTHAAEDLLDELRDNPPDQIPTVWMDLFFRTVDSVRNIVEALEQAHTNDQDRLQADRSKAYLSDLQSDLRRACEGITDSNEFSSLDADTGDDAVDSDLGDKTVTLDLETVEDIVDLMGELVIAQSGLSETLEGSLDRDQQSALKEQKKIIEQLQRRTMNLRLLPVGQTFERLPRLVRDLARDLDKEIDLHLSGGDVEMDKSLIEGIQDPLIHLIRNACDHGIESPETRRENGKPETGNLYVRAFYEGGKVNVEVEDDGAGLDRDAVVEKAVEQEMIPPDHDLDPDEIDELIVTPGFSTTEEVSDVSGRGVGMDVVASEIRDLRGTVNIDSTPGEGTTVTLELPLTVAIVDGLIVQVGGQRLIVPVSDVHQTVNPDPSELRALDGSREVLHWNDQVIPVIRPDEYIHGLQSSARDNHRPLYVLIGGREDSHALAIDRLIGYEQVVIKDLEERELAKHPLISGAAILGDGHVCFILDVNGLVRLYRTRRESSDEATPTTIKGGTTHG